MSKGCLDGKRVLLLAPSFFNYREQIGEGMARLGAHVDVHDERPGNDFLTKAMIRKNIPLIHPAVEKYYKALTTAHAGADYDFVLVIKGESLNRNAIQILRNAYPKAEFILYLWDSVENVPDCAERMKCYDRVLTFDPQDAETYKIPLRPLFFGENYQPDKAGNGPFQYDLAFIGTAHSVRPKVVLALERQCREQGRRCYHYLYLPHPLMYLYNKVTEPAYRGVKKQDLKFRPLDGKTVSEIYRESRCVLDVEHPKQRGLTMRTIELIGMGKKIVTTNRWIRKYDFYDPQNICVIDRDDPRIPEDFWGKPYVPVPERIRSAYTLETFVKDILNVKENEHG